MRASQRRQKHEGMLDSAFPLQIGLGGKTNTSVRLWRSGGAQKIADARDVWVSGEK